MEQMRVTKSLDDRDNVLAVLRSATGALQAQAAEAGRTMSAEIAQEMSGNAAEAVAALDRVDQANKIDRLETLVQELTGLRRAAPSAATTAPDPFEGLAPGAKQPWHEHIEQFLTESGVVPSTIGEYSRTYERFREHIKDKQMHSSPDTTWCRS